MTTDTAKITAQHRADPDPNWEKLNDAYIKGWVDHGMFEPSPGSGKHRRED